MDTADTVVTMAGLAAISDLFPGSPLKIGEQVGRASN
jgi:hypothetical protein